MAAPTRRTPLRPGTGSFLGCLRQFLTPAAFKQAHQAHDATPHRPKRWDLHPLLFVLLVTTWCTGDSQPERFETARAFYVAAHPKRKRPGTTAQGFADALARLPMPVLRAFAAAVRLQLLALFGADLLVGGFIPLGVDGTRLNTPRAAELERRLGQAATAAAGPQVWVTAVVHLSLGLLWAWWLGKGDANERQHLRRLLTRLPAQALLVADAGYQGYELVQALLGAGVHFLIRVSSQTTLYPEGGVPQAAWSEGVVYWWTEEARKKGWPPLRLRLIRVRRPGRQPDVWLVTSVLSAERLSREAAGRFYRLRWESEGFFRTYKRTLAKVKLHSRTVRLVHREVEGSLLAVQLLLAQGARALALLGRKAQVSSPRQVLQEIRREIQGRLGPRQRGPYLQRLGAAVRQRRPRVTSKVKRAWPSRVAHKPPQPPKLRPMPAKLKAVLQKQLEAA
jgi:hypothetical protein